MTANLKPTITLEQLRDHARSKPDHLFPLISCTECLACDLTGRTMMGHGHFNGGEPVPKGLSLFTQGYSDGSRFHHCKPVSGAEAADALDRIINGADPYLTGLDLAKNKR